MKIALVYSTAEAERLHRRGRQNQEFYRHEDVESVRIALERRGHEVEPVIGDMTIVDRLRKLSKGRNTDRYPDFMVFNLAYGVQGSNRYAQIPGLLEMLGIPYTGSGPRGHTISIDKFTANALVAEAGIPTPAAQLLIHPNDDLRAELTFPVIVKPQFESSSFGVRVVNDPRELGEAVTTIVGTFQQPAMVEAFISGRELNCGIVGNNPAHSLPVLEIEFEEGKDGDAIFDHEAKESRTWRHVCPAKIDYTTATEIQALAIRAFRILGCRDCARIDFRVDAMGRPFFLELNSMVALHRHASYYRALEAFGWTFEDMVDQIVGIAATRYATAGGYGHLWDGNIE